MLLRRKYKHTAFYSKEIPYSLKCWQGKFCPTDHESCMKSFQLEIFDGNILKRLYLSIQKFVPLKSQTSSYFQNES